MSMLPNLMYLIYSIVIFPIIYIFPAYAANGAPVLFGGGKPLDLGKMFLGKRIFGNHKTIKGTASSIAAGLIVGIIEYPFLHYMLAVAVLLTIGANIGDLFGSFIKRRMSVKSGASIPILDQYGFFVFALLFALPLGHLPDAYGLVFLVLLTGFLHVLTNRGAHKLKLKDVPW
jgi:CDP-2,3-bis-(O-geranylgeranyl)-sn-glycerol synthase